VLGCAELAEGGASTGSRPYAISGGPDGALWFTEAGNRSIGRITTDGAITECRLPTPGDHTLHGIVAAPDGGIWFTEPNSNRIGRIDPATCTLPLPPADGAPGATGPTGQQGPAGQQGAPGTPKLIAAFGSDTYSGRAKRRVTIGIVTSSRAFVRVRARRGTLTLTAVADELRATDRSRLTVRR
jgi:hypothetical protein